MSSVMRWHGMPTRYHYHILPTLLSSLIFIMKLNSGGVQIIVYVLYRWWKLIDILCRADAILDSCLFRESIPKPDSVIVTSIIYWRRPMINIYTCRYNLVCWASLAPFLNSRAAAWQRFAAEGWPFWRFIYSDTNRMKYWARNLCIGIEQFRIRISFPQRMILDVWYLTPIDAW